MRILITGVAGFVGSHLAELLLDKGIEVYGTIWRESILENISALKNSLELIECDIRDYENVQQTIVSSNPDWVYHLSAQSFVPASRKDPATTLAINVIGTANLLEAVLKCASNARVLLVGSSDQYGMVYQNELPVKESNPMRPLNPYAVSKIAQEFLGYQYHRVNGLDIVRVRSFNHVGPRQAPLFVCSDFARQIAQIEAGMKEPVMYVGNLEAQRDFSDVKDILKAYWLALEKGASGEIYNLCSGKAYSIQQVLDMLLDMSTVDIEVRQDTERMRPSDLPRIVGDYQKFEKQTGWKPLVPLNQTLADSLNYWRNQLAG